ncbi:MAG: hypothetical protein IPK60_12475 [Sandaracinaceae bacterium]|jgi:hypothetical protein|nr:hypothetical protein [Sandaracinaceae bacterium]
MWKILSLVLALALVLAGTIILLRRAPEGASTTGEALGPEVSAPPRDVARNPRAAQEFVQGRACIAACTETDRICRGSSIEPEQQAACHNALNACERSCKAAR